MELGIKESMGWNGTKLSEKPVVIFDGKSRAKYYEFIVTNHCCPVNGKTCNFLFPTCCKSIVVFLFFKSKPPL
ncbi:MAG: hypothetical protein ACPL1A_10270, partial [Candidatus Kapaibacteriota bacterium]